MKQAEDNKTIDMWAKKKYRVSVVFSYIDTIEVEADNREDAKDIAWELFDKERAVQGEGEILDVEDLR
jgi:hypothetical protein